MAEHTKLPWHASQKSVYVSDTNNRTIAEVLRDGEERAANAAFIVKAVNNHEALVKLLERSRAQHYDDGMWESHPLLIDIDRFLTDLIRPRG